MRRVFPVCAAGLLVAGGCTKEPGGQVVAVVGGEEITLKELQAEARPPAEAAPAQVEAANAAALKKLVDRNLLADYARAEGLDRAPEYVTRRRQFDQTLLAALAIRKLGGTPAKPTDAEIKAFIDANATLFAGRQKLDLDQIRIPTPSDPAVIPKLTGLQDMDAIAARLKAQGIVLNRGNAVLDTATIDPGIGKQVVALPAGEVFDITRDGFTYIAMITGRSAIAADPASWAPAAADMVRREKLATRIEAEVARLSKTASVEYDAPYRPKTAP